MRKPQTKQEYLEQLHDALQASGVKDANDIIEDYEEYFAHSTAKGYSITESIHRLPSIKELAESYGSDISKEMTSPAGKSPQPSRNGRRVLFAVTVLSELVILPFAFVAALLLGCAGISGVSLLSAGLLMAMPQGILGSITVPHPPLPQLLPAMALFMAGGMAILGVTLIIAERSYSALRMSIVLKRWMLTGKHSNHLKLIPSVSKRTRRILYATALIATLSVIASMILLVVIAAITTGSPAFFRSWKI